MLLRTYFLNLTHSLIHRLPVCHQNTLCHSLTAPSIKPSSNKTDASKTLPLGSYTSPIVSSTNSDIKPMSARVFSDIHQRFQTSYTTPCNGVISHGLNLRVFGVFTNHTRKTDAFTILVRSEAFYTCLSSHSNRSTCR